MKKSTLKNTTTKRLAKADRDEPLTVRDFCAHVEQFCHYVDDMMSTPGLMDVNVVLRKNEALLRECTFIQNVQCKTEYHGH